MILSEETKMSISDMTNPTWNTFTTRLQGKAKKGSHIAQHNRAIDHLVEKYTHNGACQTCPKNALLEDVKGPTLAGKRGREG